MIEHPFEARLDLVPTNPGVYLMKDASGSVLYVGKAVQLRNRLRSYFSDRPQGNAKVQALIRQIADFSYVLCENELEALILEANLIKQHHPRYNILLRDDKGYPYIRITMNEMYPRLLKAFRIGPDRAEGARYFGPYLAGDLYRALDALRHIFPTKTCRRVLPRDIGKQRPCLNFYIGRCVGPCRGDVPAADYRRVMEDICRFLEGKYQGILKDLTAKMQDASDQLDFERAALYRDRIQALERLMEKQKAVSANEDDLDVLGLARNGSEICLQKLEIREGRIVGASSFFLPDEEQPDKELVEIFIQQHYPETAFIPPEILIPVDFASDHPLTAYLKQLRRSRCQLHRPLRGAKKEMLQMAGINAREALQRHTLMGGHGQTALQESLRLLSDVAAKSCALHRIEAYDISNLGRSDMAASMVVFVDGRPSRQHYRQFRVQDQEQPDDYRALESVLVRRLRHLDDESFGGRPDLILVDGGLGHVNLALRVLRDQSLSIPVAGMVKDARHRTRGLALPNQQTLELKADSGYKTAAEKRDRSVSAYEQEDETLWRVAQAAAELDSDEQARSLGLLRLLTAIQDEAHRFAVQYQQKLSKKRQVRFSLEQIHGIGPAKRRLLLERFQSIKAVSQAPLAELQLVEGLGQQAAMAVYAHFHPQEGTVPAK